MIHFDVTKSGSARHRSGLTRVGARLRQELGQAAAEVRWPEEKISAGPKDWLLTAELFSEAERPGVAAFLARRPCRCAAIFHDAIPLRHPHITWPRSVARHPGYMKLLAGFDRVWANSAASRDDLLGFWRWQGLEATPPVEVLTLGADFDPAVPRASAPASPAGPPALLGVGILEPRKNQAFLLEVCAELWRGGLAFDLHLAGRVNPHFGAPVRKRLREMSREFPGLHYHGPASDGALARLYASVRASVFPTLAEGCGLPLLESLWMGVPCLGSDLPALRESAAGGGCDLLPPNDAAAWKAALRRALTDDSWLARRRAEALARPLPTWNAAAKQLIRALA